MKLSFGIQLLTNKLIESLCEKRYSYSVIFVFTALTIALLIVVLTAQNDVRSSWDPPGKEVELQKIIDQNFPQRTHVAAFILEDKNKDILRQKPLWDLYQRELILRELIRDYLFDQYDLVNERQIFGIFTMADAVHKGLRAKSAKLSLETANDTEVKSIVREILANDVGGELKDSLSRDLHLTLDQDGNEIWAAEAMTIFVTLDNNLLGGGRTSFSLTSDPAILFKEQLGREIEMILLGDQLSYNLWGLAIDTNLETIDESSQSLPYIILAILLVNLVAALSLRSLKSFIVIGIGLLVLMAWLMGISSLLGIKKSITTDLIVPIAMVSLGVDFFIHSISRYQEELGKTPYPRKAMASGLIAVSGAITLAMISDGIAFMANLTSNIETIVDFGIAAGIAVGSAYIVMGWVLPLVLLEIDSKFNNHRPVKIGFIGNNVAKSVLFTERMILNLSQSLMRKWKIVIIVALGFTGVCLLISLQIKPDFDVKDFFDSDSRLVIGLDKLDQHVDQSLLGEPVFILLEIPSNDIRSIRDIRLIIEMLAKSNDVTKDSEGNVFLYLPSLDEILQVFLKTPYAVNQFNMSKNINKDQKLDPQTPILTNENLEPIILYMRQNGVPLRANLNYMDAEQVKEIVAWDINLKKNFSVLVSFGILGTREQTNVPVIKQNITAILENVSEQLVVDINGITGSAFIRSTTLSNTTDLMKKSLPVAIVSCFLVLWVCMRSWKHALVTIMPVAFVVTWVLAFMVLFGMYINFVTATIAAVTVGVGVDFSIHMTQRYRQELKKGFSREKAIANAVPGTGRALLGSALSSALGFSVMMLAPMPIIATYGLLTSVMILFAAIGALFVLPSLLIWICYQD